MELAELTALLTPEGLRLVDDLGALESTDEVAAAVSRVRAAGHSPDLVSAAVGQARLRHRARWLDYLKELLDSRSVRAASHKRASPMRWP